MLLISCTKNLTTLGEGGAIYVKNANLAKKVSGLRHNGHCDYKKRKYYWKPAMGNLDIDLKDKWSSNLHCQKYMCSRVSFNQKNKKIE